MTKIHEYNVQVQQIEWHLENIQFTKVKLFPY